MRIIIYSHHVRLISGVQTWEKAFIQAMGHTYDIQLVYRTANVEKLEEFKRIVECIEYNGQEIECDVCIYSSTIRKQPKIKAKKYIKILHCDLKRWDSSYSSEGVDVHVAVSKQVARGARKDFGLQTVVIPNLLPEQDVDPFVRFVTCSRIAEGKGFERMVEMAKIFKQSGKRFIWEVYGGGSGQSKQYLEGLRRQLDDVPEVVFLGPRDKPQSYMVDADYVVQLSDNEGFCYSIHEALQVGTPCIVTDWPGARRVITHGFNGYVLNMALTNLNTDKIFKKELRPPRQYFPRYNITTKWRSLLDNLVEA
jgi:glycosyltransferase involved in cell wall biosynthesis